MKKLLLFCLCLLSSLFASSQAPISIVVKCNANNSYDIFYRKESFGSYQVRVKFFGATNVFEDEINRTITDNSGLLATLYPANKSQPVTYSSCKWIYARGVPCPKLDTTFTYALPFKENVGFHVYSAGHQPTYQSAKSNLYTFIPQLNDTVLAIRKGVVIDVVNQFVYDQSVSRFYQSNLNRIVVEHDDGTFAEYTGFLKGQIFVLPGQSVLPYSPLGRLGSYDISGELKLNVRLTYNKGLKNEWYIESNGDNKKKESILGNIAPYFFTGHGAESLKSGFYTGAFNKYILECELNRKELKQLGCKTRARRDFAFNRSPVVNKPDTTFYNKYNKRVASLVNAYFYEVRTIAPSEPNVLTMREYYKSGQLKCEHLFTNKTDSIDKRNCYWFFRDEDTGVLWVKHGKSRAWYPDGKLKQDIMFRYGNINGKIITYWDNGLIKRTNSDEKGNYIKDRCFDRNGKEVPAYQIALAGHFRKGNSSVVQYLDSAIVYPDSAIILGKNGSVEAGLSIDSLGQVKDVEILRSAGLMLDNAVKQAIKSMQWRPGLLDGETYAIYRKVSYFCQPLKKQMGTLLKAQSADTTFFNAQGQILPDITLASMYEILNPIPGDSARVRELRFYRSGKKMAERTVFKKNVLNPIAGFNGNTHTSLFFSDAEQRRLSRIPDGESREWYDGGNLAKSAYYKSGLKDGVFLLYWENGKIRRQDEYKDGELISGTCYDMGGNQIAYFPADSKLSYPGGEAALQSVIIQNIKYPELVKKINKQEIVTLNLLIDKTGTIRQICKDKNSDNNRDLLNEAFRLARLLKKWLPEYKDGEPVSSIYVLPVTF